MFSSPAVLGASLLAVAHTAIGHAVNLTGTYDLHARAAYGLVDTYNSGNFWSSFNFYTGSVSPTPRHLIVYIC